MEQLTLDKRMKDEYGYGCFGQQREFLLDAFYIFQEVTYNMMEERLIGDTWETLQLKWKMEEFGEGQILGAKWTHWYEFLMVPVSLVEFLW